MPVESLQRGGIERRSCFKRRLTLACASGLSGTIHDDKAAGLRSEAERRQPLGDLPDDAGLRHRCDRNRIAQVPLDDDRSGLH